MFNVTLRQLQVFEAVSRHLSFTRAAEELHLTQPAVSMQIRQLEDHVGLALFEQLGKKNYLTQAGKEVYHYTTQMLRQLQEMEDVVEDLKGSRRGILDIAVATTANDFATRILASFAKDYENLTYRLDVTNRETLLNHLESNDKDLVIMGRPPDGLGLLVEPFMDNPLVVVAPPEHELAHVGKVDLERLVKENFVMREKVSGTRIAMERFFANHGLEANTYMEMTSNEAIKQAVEAGLGLGIVSLHTLRLELETEKLVILDVEDFPIKRHWYLVYRDGKRLSPVTEAFREYVLKRASEFAISSL